jgi:Na+-driven multidrug efflux pump
LLNIKHSLALKYKSTVFFSLFLAIAFMCGTGDTIITMFITLFVLWVIRVPASYLLAEKFGVTGIWWAVPLGWSAGMILAWLYYFTGRWKTKGVVKRKEEEE